jgi:hypothetical protein
MQSRILKLGLCLAVTLLMAAALASAQSIGYLKAEIPFNFHAGTAILPAGTYLVKINFSPSGAIVLKSEDNSASMMIQTFPQTYGTKEAPAKLIFNRYGSQYFLSQVWEGGYSVGRGLPKTNLEREFAKNSLSRTSNEVALGH